MIYIVAFLIITVTDALILNIFLKSFIADHNTTPPPALAECFAISGGANLIAFLLRIAGTAIPFDLGVYGYLFWNKYGLNTVAVIVCLAIMWVINVVTLMGTFALFLAML